MIFLVGGRLSNSPFFPCFLNKYEIFLVGFPILFSDFSYIRLCTTEGEMTISMRASLFVKISFIYKPVEVSSDPALLERITAAGLDPGSTVLKAKRDIC